MYTETINSERVRSLAAMLADWAPAETHTVYGIPNSGKPVAFAVAEALRQRFPDRRIYVTDISPLSCDIGSEGRDPKRIFVVDDVYASGKTAKPFLDAGLVVGVLVIKTASAVSSPNLLAGHVYAHDAGYITFPWEGDSVGPEDAVRRLLEFMHVDPDLPDVRETPRRVLEWLATFRDEEPFQATTFDGVSYGGMVAVRDIPFVSMCAHHLLPFIGTAHVAYIPRKTKTLGHEVLGISKLARIVLTHARKPTMQEALTEDITNEIKRATGSKNVAVVLSAEHMCMSLRGPRVGGAKTVTSRMTGAFKQNDRTREEFMLLTRDR